MLPSLIERTTGEVYFGLGQSKDAISHLISAADFAEKMVAIYRPHIPELLDAATFIRYWEMFTASPARPAWATRRRRPRNIGAARNSIEMMVRKDPQMSRARRGIAINRLKLGDLTRFGDPEAALDDYRQGLSAFDSLPNDESNRPANLRFRAQFLRKVGGDSERSAAVERGRALSELSRWPFSRRAWQPIQTTSARNSTW